MKPILDRKRFTKKRKATRYEGGGEVVYDSHLGLWVAMNLLTAEFDCSSLADAPAPMSGAGGEFGGGGASGSWSDSSSSDSSSSGGD